MRADSIKIASFNARLLHVPATTLIEIRPQTTDKIVRGKQNVGTPLSSQGDVQKSIDRELVSALNRSDTKDKLLDMLRKRPDQGFGLGGANLNVAFLSDDFSWHEACRQCTGQGRVACMRCHGQMREQCPQCHGRTMTPCPMCRGTGHVNGQDGRPQPCSKCHGQRQVICLMCHRTGKIPCRQCKGTGHSQCTSCGGSGWFTHVVHLATQAVTYFDYDRSTLPPDVIKILDSDCAGLAKRGDVHVTAHVAENKKNALGLEYDVQFPYGEVVFTIGKKPLKARIFGYNATLLDMPPFLEKLIARGYSELEAAAAGAGSVSRRLRRAGRFKLLAMALLAGAQSSPKKAAALLLRKYPLGLSPEAAYTIAELADKATAKITRKPRYVGLALGLAVVAGLYAFYYIGPGRGLIAPMIGDARLNIIIDLMLVVIGGTLTTLSIQLAAKTALHEAIGHLAPAKERRKLLPKTRSSGWWGYAGGGAIYWIMIEATAHLAGPNTPAWYAALRRIVLQALGLA